jgi:hypothetical protein
MANNKAHTDLYGKAVTANDVQDNGATVLMGGSIDGTNTVTNAPAESILGAGRRAQPKPVASAYTGAGKANDSGDFAELGDYIVKGGNVTTKVAGIAYTGLRGGGNQNQIRGLHTLLTRTTVLIDSWNYATGVPTYNENNPSSDDFDNGSFAAPTRALPGNLVIIQDGKSVDTEAYQAKDGGA